MDSYDAWRTASPYDGWPDKENEDDQDLLGDDAPDEELWLDEGDDY